MYFKSCRLCLSNDFVLLHPCTFPHRTKTSGLAGKCVIVTGSSSGKREATAILFARKGCNVTLCGQDSGRLQEAEEKCKQAGAAGGHTNRFITVAVPL
ncbi:hypothetical protein RRG08_033598 [Elysia crispata]|uniref:Uncharacterized protein n=1 Tax=Elysia crispata TaxID=231223 RepID=A0AAE0XQP4_9GAST|nr:hypothetical protein RRG08_033598 [Elysia crispata]